MEIVEIVVTGIVAVIYVFHDTLCYVFTNSCKLQCLEATLIKTDLMLIYISTIDERRRHDFTPSDKYSTYCSKHSYIKLNIEW